MPRPIVLLGDVSGSMERYSRVLAHFVYGLAQSATRVEVFLFATRLTRVTQHMRARRGGDALAGVAREVRDWGGGTRIGEALRAFNTHWARRVVRNGPVVLIVSDGWDRGDPGAPQPGARARAPQLPAADLAQPAAGLRAVRAAHTGHAARRCGTWTTSFRHTISSVSNNWPITCARCRPGHAPSRGARATGLRHGLERCVRHPRAVRPRVGSPDGHRRDRQMPARQPWPAPDRPRSLRGGAGPHGRGDRRQLQGHRRARGQGSAARLHAGGRGERPPGVHQGTGPRDARARRRSHARADRGAGRGRRDDRSSRPATARRRGADDDGSVLRVPGEAGGTGLQSWSAERRGASVRRRAPAAVNRAGSSRGRIFRTGRDYSAPAVLLRS